MKTQPVTPDKILIIGSGIGGLSTAIILAKLGFQVTVLEKNTRPGGLMRSYTRGGVECEVGVHYLGSLDNGQILWKFFNYLGVSQAIPVLRMGKNGIIDRYLFDDSTGTHPPIFDMPWGLDAYEENLCQAFPEEQHIIAQILTSIRKAAAQLHGLDLLYTADNNFSLLDQAEPLGKMLDDLGCSSGLRSVLAIPSSWIGVPLDDCPAYYHHMALASYVSSSYRLECSGSAMADAFAARLRELGGKIITRAAVRKIHVQSRVVTGLELDSGEILDASTVIGAVHPKVVLQMLPPGAVKPSYRKRISSLVDTHGVFSVHAAVNSRRHPEIPYNIFKIDTDTKGNVPDLRYYQIRKSEKQDISLLSILTSGKDELWSPWLQTKTGQRSTGYASAKKQQAELLIREAEELFGAFQNLTILDSYTPLTIRDWVNSPGGSAYGVLRSSSQILGTALLNRTAVKGLWLCGQNVMAPGIIGTIMGSFSTVQQLLGENYFKQNIQL